MGFNIEPQSSELGTYDMKGRVYLLNHAKQRSHAWHFGGGGGGGVHQGLP